eukprot:5358631-Amphidinium_carterae.1
MTIQEPQNHFRAILFMLPSYTTVPEKNWEQVAAPKDNLSFRLDPKGQQQVQVATPQPVRVFTP